MEKNSNIVIGIVALIVGIGIGYLASGGSFRDSGGYMMPGGFTASQNIDRHFIEEMIPHHEGAIEMAKLALLRSKRPEMQTLANGIIEAQEREINNMKGWYEAWFGTAVPAYSSGMMGGMGHGVGMQMGSMESSRGCRHWVRALRKFFRKGRVYDAGRLHREPKHRPALYRGNDPAS